MMSKSKFPYTTIACDHKTKKRLKKFAKEKDETFDEILNRLMSFAQEHGFERFPSTTK